jgi:hypothetical protein
MLVGLDQNGEVSGEGVAGITRLQKFAFLLEKEANIAVAGNGFDFVPYKAGPYSAHIYDDMEMLENLGLVESSVTSEATDEECVEADALTFDALIGGKADTVEDARLAEADAYEERRFRLTARGRARVEELLASGQYAPFVNGIRKVKSRYGHYSLQDLLYHVYTRYPDMTTESQIRERVLSRRRRSL